MKSDCPQNQLNIKLLPKQKKIFLGTKSVSFKSKPVAWRILKKLAESNKPLNSNQILEATYDFWTPTRSVQFHESMRKAMVRTMSRVRAKLKEEFDSKTKVVQFLDYDKTEKTWQFASIKN